MDNEGKNETFTPQSDDRPIETKCINNSASSSVANLDAAPQISFVGYATLKASEEGASLIPTGSRHSCDVWYTELNTFHNETEKANTSTNKTRKLCDETSEAREQMRTCVNKWLQTRIDEECHSIADHLMTSDAPNISEFCKEQLLERIIKLEEFTPLARNCSPTETHEESSTSAKSLMGLSQSSQGEYEMLRRTSEDAASVIMCRICYHESWGTPELGPLVSPCNCRGSVQMVHMPCLERWLSESGTDTCDLCGFRFRVRWSQRASLLHSFLAWVCTEEEALQLLMDLVLLLIVTPMVLYTAHRCVEASHILFVSRSTSELLLVSVLLLFGYFAQVSYYFWIACAFFYHATNWLRWWRTNFAIEILPPEVS